MNINDQVGLFTMIERLPNPQGRKEIWGRFKCISCGAEKEGPLYRAKNGKLACSCKYFLEKTCEVCGESFQIQRSYLTSRPAKFCSQTCRDERERSQIMGMQFDNWKVIGLKKDGEKGTKYEVFCETCGTTKWSYKRRLERHLIPLCKCVRYAGFKDISSFTYGKWTVIEPVERSGKDSSVYWLCQCECGNEGIIAGTALRDGKTQSCGCSSKIPWEGVSFRSAWEVSVAMVLSQNGILWQYEPANFTIDVGEKSRIYIPDFYIPSLDLWVEVKGEQVIAFNPSSIEKIKIFGRTHPLSIIDKTRLRAMIGVEPNVPKRTFVKGGAEAMYAIIKKHAPPIDLLQLSSWGQPDSWL